MSTTQHFTVNNEQPFDSLGLFTYLRTYARRHDEEDPHSTVETWKECVTRVVNGCNSQLNTGFTPEENQEFFDLIYNLKCSVAGRFLWQLGTKTVGTLGLMSLQNCAFTVMDDPVKPFTWIMNFLMLGAGCGYRITPEDAAKFPVVQFVKTKRVDTKDVDYIVPDTRQGWIKLLGKLLKAHFYSGEGFTYSCMLLRSKGAPIKGFGGLSSGPEILCDGIDKINTILNGKVGKNISTVDILDICNIIGMVVVSGNVRRSAQIAIGSATDIEYMKAKRWDLGMIPNWRCYSNNSVICNDISEIIDNQDFWAGYNGKGEPYGLINLKLSQSCGRLGETQYPDPTVEGFNPCAEQGLSRWETCCLGEIYLPNISTYEELKTCVTYIYRTCKHSLTLPCVDSKETEKVVHENFRMGIGVTGYLQATEEQRNWLKDCYTYLRDFDVFYSNTHGFPRSVKLTTCKPSGTLSLLGHCTSGVHPGFAQYYIRRIRVSSESKLIGIAKSHGYHVEYVQNFDGTPDYNTQVISFPYALPEGTILAENCTAVQQLNYVKRLQTEWSDNAVSVTVYYRKEELDEIKEWLRANYNHSIKTVSFLLHSDHGFKQAPLEKITKEQYDEMMMSTTPISDVTSICYNASDDKYIGEGECSGGACPLK
jgi:ribonucleoside-triphosphate reductase